MDKMISKIKALLAKAQGTDNQAEAEVFFAKAYELMERHQLDAMDLDRDDPMGHDGAAYVRKGAAAPDWDFRLMHAVARYYGCMAVAGKTVDGQGYWNGNRITLIGRESARVTALEMHQYLINTVRRLGRANAADMGVKPDTAIRRIGVELKARLDAITSKRPNDGPKTEAAKNALMTVDQVNALAEKLFPDLRIMKGGKLKGNLLARELAKGIGLSHQMNTQTTRRLT